MDARQAQEIIDGCQLIAPGQHASARGSDILAGAALWVPSPFAFGALTYFAVRVVANMATARDVRRLSNENLRWVHHYASQNKLKADFFLRGGLARVASQELERRSVARAPSPSARGDEPRYERR
jgi:hypothetical protein